MKPGDVIILSITLGGREENKHVRAILEKDDNTDLAGSPIDLAHVGNGKYYYSDPGLTIPTGTTFVDVTYNVYDDAGYTILSSEYDQTSEKISISDTDLGELETKIDDLTEEVAALPSEIYLSMFPQYSLIALVSNTDPPSTINKATVIRGEDRDLYIRLRDKVTGDPFDLTGITQLEAIFRKPGNTRLTKDDTVLDAVAAYETYQNVVYTAVTAGEVGNAIELTFDGVDSISDDQAAWNVANPTNMVGHDAGDDSVVPSVGSIQLQYGREAGADLEVIGSLELGKFRIRFNEEDTNMLKPGKRQDFTIAIHRGVDTRRVIVESSLDVLNS